MDLYCKVDGESTIDPAAEFVDTFYSYKDSRYEITVEALNGEEDSFIFDLYNHSRPLTPFSPEPNKASSLVKAEDPNILDCKSASNSDIASIISQKETKVETDSVRATMKDQGRRAETVEETNLHNMPQKHLPTEIAHVHN